MVRNNNVENQETHSFRAPSKCQTNCCNRFVGVRQKLRQFFVDSPTRRRSLAGDPNSRRAKGTGSCALACARRTFFDILF